MCGCCCDCGACTVVCVACVYTVRMLGSEGDDNAGVGSWGCVVDVSAYMSGTRGSGVLSSTCDVLEMSLVRGVCEVCDMCMCLARGGRCGGEWNTGLGLGFTNSAGTLGNKDMCLCFGCGGVGDVGREWMGGLGHGGLGGVMYCVCCGSGFSVLMAGPSICIVCRADSCAS